MNANNSDRLYSWFSRRGLWVIMAMMSFTWNMAQAQEESVESDAVVEEETVVKPKPVKNTFESIWLIDAQTVMVPYKGTFEMDFQHRFGTWNNGYEDFYGVFAASNIRMGFSYVPVDRLMVGFGLTKFNNLWDFHGKYAIMEQKKEGGSAVSLSYYFNAAVDTRREEDTDFTDGTDRWSFFHQIMVARKISDKFSIQASGNLSWFNYKDVYDSNGEFLGEDQKAHFSGTLLARYKISNTIGITLEYDQPFTSSEEILDPEPNLSLGLELVTSSHAFQLFVGNYQSLVPQYNHTFNTNNFFDNEILIGFNITRLWNF
jgi:hypothetical protein